MSHSRSTLRAYRRQSTASVRYKPSLQSAVWRATSIAVALVATVCLFFTGTGPASAAHDPQPTLPTVQLLIDGKAMTAEVASSRQQRFMGLSFRESMQDDNGMLFSFETEQPLVFTMRNTLIPLSIAYISKDWVINEIHHMNVGPNQYFPAVKLAQYALEVNQGWFAQYGIEPGAQIVMK